MVLKVFFSGIFWRKPIFCVFLVLDFSLFGLLCSNICWGQFWLIYWPFWKVPLIFIIKNYLNSKNINFLTKVLQCQKHKFGNFSKRSRWKKVFSTFLSSKYNVETCADFGFFSKFFPTLCLFCRNRGQGKEMPAFCCVPDSERRRRKKDISLLSESVRKKICLPFGFRENCCLNKNILELSLLRFFQCHISIFQSDLVSTAVNIRVSKCSQIYLCTCSKYNFFILGRKSTKKPITWHAPIAPCLKTGWL